MVDMHEYPNREPEQNKALILSVQGKPISAIYRGDGIFDLGSRGVLKEKTVTWLEAEKWLEGQSGFLFDDD